MAPASIGGLRRAAVLAATLALLGAGIAPAHAAEPAPLPVPPTRTTDSGAASDVFGELRAETPEGSPLAFLSEAGDAAVSANGFAAGEEATITGGGITGTITYLDYSGAVAPLQSAHVMAWRWDDAVVDWVYVAEAYSEPGTGAYTFADLPAGDYVLLVFDEAPGTILIPEFLGDAPYVDLAEVVTVTEGQLVTGADERLEPLLKGRIAGQDRYETAVQLSQSFETAPCVFIASGQTFPDALSAGPAAAHCGGPLLLVRSASVPESVIAEIKRLSPERIVVAGGTGAVSLAVEQALRPLAPEFTRYAGTDRYDTSRKIVAGEFGTSFGAWVATGADFPDALSASAAAAASGVPVLIVPGFRSTLDASSKAALTSLGVGVVAIAGGPGAVSLGIETGIAAIPSVDGAVIRLGGKNRYDTAFQIMDFTWTYDGAWAIYAFFTSGTNFPDALAGALVAGLLGAPLYVTPATCTSAAIQQQVRSLEVAEGYVLGYYQQELYYEGGQPFRTC